MPDCLGRITYRIFAWDPKPYIGFRNLTVAVFALWICNFAFILWATPRLRLASPIVASIYQKNCMLSRSPWTILLGGAMISLGALIIGRYRTRYYVARHPLCDALG